MFLYSHLVILYSSFLAWYRGKASWLWQNMQSYFAGIDAGTSGAAVIISDERGRVVSSGFADYSCIYGSEGRVEQDAAVLWAGVCEASRKAVAGLPGHPSTVRSIAVASQRGTFLAVDRRWLPLMNSIVWADRRAGVETELLRARFGEARFHQVTGARLSEIWACSKVYWLVRNRSDVVERTWKFVNGQEWVLHNLGSESVFTDASAATMNGMMDMANKRWSAEVLSAIDIPEGLMPPLVSSMTGVGSVSPAASQATGFARGTPLFVGGGDQQCAAVGAGIIRPGFAELALGTGSVLITPVESYVHDPRNTLLYGAHILPLLWDLEGISLSAGNCYRWWSQTLAAGSHGAHRGSTGYEALDMEAESVRPGSEGLIFLPYFFGQFVPRYDSDMSGAFLGLRSSHGTKAMTRAVLEGISFEIRTIRDAMTSAISQPLERIVLTGGGSKSREWTSILANVLGTPIARPVVSECTALGAAILGAVGVGGFQSVDEAVASMVHVQNPIDPNPIVSSAYEDLYEVFVQATDALAANNLSRKLRDLAEKTTSGAS